MKVTNFLLETPGSIGARARLTHGSMFGGPARREDKTRGTEPRPLGILERLDRWFWRQEVRDREAYLAKARDVFDLEERIRRLERSVGSRYY